MERGADGWTLIEVKSSLDVKEKHLADAAIQAHVLRRGGMGVRRVESCTSIESADSRIFQSLLAYCKQDTWAMVRLLARLRELAIGG